MKRTVGAALAALALAVSADAAAKSACVSAADKGQDLRAAGKLREARAALLACAQPTCHAVVRADCARWIGEIDHQMPSLVVRAIDARGRDVLGVTVTLDDAPIDRLDGAAIPVDPGAHVLRARAASGDGAEAKASVVVGDHAHVVELRFDRALDEDGRPIEIVPAPAKLRVEPAPAAPDPAAAPAAEPSAPVPVVPIALGAVGVAALGAFGFFEIEGQSRYSALERGCGRTQTCTDSDVGPVRSQFVAAGVSLGIAAVALGAATFLYLTRNGASAPPSAARRVPAGIAF